MQPKPKLRGEVRKETKSSAGVGLEKESQGKSWAQNDYSTEQFFTWTMTGDP